MPKKSLVSVMVLLLMLLTSGPVIDWIKTLLALPVMPPNDSGFPMDKLVHCVLFAGCTWGCLMDWRARYGTGVVIFVMLALAAGTEFLQIFIPQRSGDWADLLADGVGVALGLWWYHRQKKARFATTGL